MLSLPAAALCSTWQVPYLSVTWLSTSRLYTALRNTRLRFPCWPCIGVLCLYTGACSLGHGPQRTYPSIIRSSQAGCAPSEWLCRTNVLCCEQSSHSMACFHHTSSAVRFLKGRHTNIVILNCSTQQTSAVKPTVYTCSIATLILVKEAVCSYSSVMIACANAGHR